MARRSSRRPVGGGNQRRFRQGRSSPVGQGELPRHRDATFRAPIAVPPVIGLEPGSECPLRRKLQFRVEGGDRLVAGIDVGAVAFHQLLPHPFRRKRCHQVQLAPVNHGGDGRRHRLFVLGTADGRLVQHPPQHEVAPPDRVFRPVDGIARLRPLGHRRQHGNLGKVELGDRLAVVGVGAGLDAVGVLPERRDVDVELENLLLGERVLDLHRQQHLLEFADEGLLRREGDDLRKLHRDGARAGANVGQEQPHHVVGEGDHVHASVLEEALVLGVEEGVDVSLWRVLEGNGDRAAVAELPYQLVVSRENPKRRFESVFAVGLRGRNLRVQIEKN